MANRTVIFVPGITGSEIRYVLGAGLFRACWLSPTALLVGGFRDLRLPVLTEGDAGPIIPAKAGGPPLGFYYGTFLNFMRVHGWRVVSPKLDWRKPMVSDSAALLDLIRAESADGPVRIVCHSRGGLLVRRALSNLAAAGSAAAVSLVVGLGVPHTGSLSAAAYVSGDAAEVRLVRQLLDLLPHKLPSRFAVQQITRVTRSWQGLYELMPAAGNSWFDAAQTAALYSPATWEPSVNRPVSAYLPSALSNWATLPPPPDSVQWIDVAGVGIRTPGSIDSLDDLARTGGLNYDADGDGTVPLASAHPSGRPLCTTPTGHAALAVDPRVWQLTTDLLFNGASAVRSITGETLSL